MRYCVVRSVRDDFQALLMGDAMMQAGVEPFSIVIDPRTDLEFRWRVYGKYDGPQKIEDVVGVVDTLFDAKMGRK